MGRTQYINKDSVNKLLLEYYIITERIGKGSFGEVYLAEDKKDRLYALKIEDKHTNKTKLEKEYKVYRALKDNNVQNVPKLFRFIKTEDYNILVMELLGPSLEELLNIYERKLNLYSVLNLGYSIIDSMEAFHETGYVHRDIKPNNFLIGRKENTDKIYIMDFGLSKKYISDDQHISEGKIKSLIGTPRYASINVHNGIEPTRRDDLESIGYMLIYLLKGTLPWQGIKGPKKSDMYRLIGEKKKTMSLDELTSDIPSCFKNYLKNVRELKYSEKPDYNYLKNLFSHALPSSNNYAKYIWLNNSSIGSKS